MTRRLLYLSLRPPLHVVNRQDGAGNCHLISPPAAPSLPAYFVRRGAPPLFLTFFSFSSDRDSLESLVDLVPSPLTPQGECQHHRVHARTPCCMHGRARISLPGLHILPIAVLVWEPSCEVPRIWSTTLTPTGHERRGVAISFALITPRYP